jgi:hypothetical protein
MNMFPEDQDPADRMDSEPDERRKFAERLLPELIKRVVEAGVGKLAEGPENLRHFVGELKLPKEIANYLFAQIDETKNGLYRVVAKEIRDFLETTNIAEEITNALTKLSFEIRTEIRFVPNDNRERLFPKPDVKADVVISPPPSTAPKAQAPGNPEKHKEERPARRRNR